MNDSRDLPVSGAASITGRSAFLGLLEAEGVEYLFGNPGTTELAIMQALGAHPQLRYVLGLQEAIVVAMADGYARASNRLAACNVHVAPGLGNAMGALFNAKWYGSPLLITAGQQEQGHGLMEPLLYDPLVPIAQPMVKWAIEVTRVQDLPRIVHRAAKTATTPPTGPVFISLPGDILDAEASLDLGKPTRVDAANRPSDAALERLAGRLLEARAPVLIAGHELSTYDALAEAAELAELLGAPVYQQTVPYSAQYLSEHPTFLCALTRNQQQVRAALQPYDLLAFLGADVLRMSVFNRVDPLPEGVAVLQISERDWELAKNYPAEIAIKANIKETLRALLPVVRAKRSAERAAQAERRLAELASQNWTAKRRRLVQEVQSTANAKPIDPRFLMMRISETLSPDAVVVEEGVTSTFSLLSFLPLRDAHGYHGLASGGIGFAMAGAIGVSLALPGRPVVAIVGDGSAMYSIQALWTAAHLKLPITYVIANNRSYRILKERLRARQDSAAFIGMDLRDPEIDFVRLAESLGVPARRVTDAADIVPALRAATAAGGPNLIDVGVADGFGR
ncbi:MAG TPA: thiamine pyrophosphate-dependent enzyme [Burkholderiales bacterium]|nr:thiamine pyrophosphate-dependent enzyme [Burkholderiales bacterium]